MVRYRQLKSVLTKAKTIEDLLPGGSYFTIKSVHSLNRSDIREEEYDRKCDDKK